MGIRINSAIAIGVKFTDKESRLFEKFTKDKGLDWFTLRWIEETLKKEFSMEGKEGRYIYSCHTAFMFAKRNKKTQKCLKPYRPFWDGYSQEKIKDLEKYLPDKAEEYLESINCPSEAKSVENLRIWYPDKDRDGKPGQILAYVQERNYAREVDYGLIDIIDIGHTGEPQIFVVKGDRPWECGTQQFKKGNEWQTFNGQHFLPERYLPKENRKEILQQILFHTGSKASFIKKKRDLWDKYHGDMRPYKIYPGEGWHGSDFNFYPIDTMYQLICKYIPEIKYDVMKLEKYLCFYWS